MDGSYVTDIIINGLSAGSVYALVALGLTFVFGILNIVNFAHGQMMLTAAYVMIALQQSGVPLGLAVLIACIGAAIAGALVDVSLFARVRKEPVNGLLISVGLIAVLANIQYMIWGPDPYRLDVPISGEIQILGVDISARRLWIIVSMALILIVLALFLKYTRIGLGLRATGQNSEAALLMGMPVERIRTLAFAISAVLAALAGALIGFILPIEPVLQESLLITGFIALILGGAGSPVGAVLGGFILGLIQSFGITLFSAELAETAMFLVLIIVLFFRPTGIIKSRQEVTL